MFTALSTDFSLHCDWIFLRFSFDFLLIDVGLSSELRRIFFGFSPYIHVWGRRWYNEPSDAHARSLRDALWNLDTTVRTKSKTTFHSKKSYTCGSDGGCRLTFFLRTIWVKLHWLAIRSTSQTPCSVRNVSLKCVATRKTFSPDSPNE